MEFTRNYNKLYCHTNREEGSDKIILGYATNNKEIVFKANGQTTFHVPYYVSDITLEESSLVADGATAGPFPEASDKIYENRKGYGNVTSNGETLYPTGELFCSWLSGNNNGQTKWVDRYYYSDNDSFEDVQSTITLTSGVEYIYDRVGEHTSAQIIDNFAGKDGSRLRLNLEKWTNELDNIDNSLNPIPVKIITNGPVSEILKINSQTNRVSADVISFENNYKIEAFIPWDPKYSVTEEFTWSLWAKSPDWSKTISTQLMGNFSSNGGAGIFIETLSSYPFFVVPILSYSPDPRTNVGHILYVNQSYDAYKDRQLNYVNLNPKGIAQPEFICLNSDHHLIVLCTDAKNMSLYKFDNTGEPLKAFAVNELFANNNLGTDRLEFPIKIMCGNVRLGTTPTSLRNDIVIVITNKARYFIDSNLTELLLKIEWPIEDPDNWSFAFGIDPTTNMPVFFQENKVTIKIYNPDGSVSTKAIIGVRDLKIINGKRWVIASDGNLYQQVDIQNGVPIFELYNSFEYTGAATNFEIDPYDRLWVLHGNNSVSVFDYRYLPINGPLFRFESGFNVPHSNKHISFSCTNNRTTGETQWNCLIYYGDSGDSQVGPQVYVYKMDGKLYRSVDIIGCFDAVLLLALKQEISQFRFTAKGDFTGYERKRIFDKTEPYNNNPQLVLKYCTTDLKALTADFRFNPLEKVIFKKLTPINGWGYNSWQHFALISKDRISKMYINGILLSDLTIDLSQNLRYDLTFKSQPPFYIGVPLGSQISINEETKTTAAIFNGTIEDIKIYDYALNQRDLKLFLTKTVPAEDLRWNLMTPSVQYLEQIDRMFKNKIPGAKSSFFNINLCGTGITDPTTRKIIEEEVKNLVTNIKPVHTDFLNIKWID